MPQENYFRRDISSCKATDFTKAYLLAE